MLLHCRTSQAQEENVAVNPPCFTSTPRSIWKSLKVNHELANGHDGIFPFSRLHTHTLLRLSMILSLLYFKT